MTITISNYLTLGRLVLVPVFWYCFFSDRWGLQFTSTLIVAIGALTDMWDGKIARRRGEITIFGIFMDPLADKFLILSGFWAILIKEDLPGFWLFTASMVAITSIRELGITLFRINSLRSGISVAASIWGKWKTGVQLTALLVTLTALNTRDLLVDLGYTGYPFSGTILSGSIAVMFSLCAIIAVISGWFYLRDTRQ